MEMVKHVVIGAIIGLIFLGAMAIFDINQSVRVNAPFTLISGAQKYTCQIVEAETGFLVACLEGVK